MTKDIRWIQRLGNLERAHQQFALFLAQERLNKLEEQGLIQSFEYTHELAWKTMKDFLIHRGVSDLFGSKDTTKAAFGLGLIGDGAAWMRMIQSRNMTSHTYNEATALEIIRLIRAEYAPAFEGLIQTLAGHRSQQQGLD